MEILAAPPPLSSSVRHCCGEEEDGFPVVLWWVGFVGVGEVISRP